MELTEPLFNIENGIMTLTPYGISMIHSINAAINIESPKEAYINILSTYLNIQEL